MVMPLNDWVFVEIKRPRDLAQELFEPMGSLEQLLERALVLVGLVSGEIQQNNF